MKAHMLNLRRTLVNPRFVRNFTQQGSGPSSSGTPSSKPAAPQPPNVTGDVPGLSGKIVKPSSGPVGPGASATGDYKVPEYFLYNRTSYFEAEIEMSNFRCPQPNAYRK